MKCRTLFILAIGAFVFFYTASAHALLKHYTFSGSAVLDDPLGLTDLFFGANYPDEFSFYGSFSLDTRIHASGRTAHNAYDMRVFFPGFSVSRDEGRLSEGYYEYPADHYYWEAVYYDIRPSTPEGYEPRWGELWLGLPYPNNDFEDFVSSEFYFSYVHGDDMQYDYMFYGTIDSLRLNPVPEPTSILLLGIGTLVLSVWRKFYKSI